MPLELSRTFDYQLVKAIVTNPRLYPHIATDFHPKAKDFEPNHSEAIHYMLVTDGAEILGVVTAHSIITHEIWEVHHAILPSAWSRTAEIAALFEHWLFSETPCQVAVGHTPACNKLACRFALKHGMTQTGVIPKAYRRDGNLHDLIIFTKNKPHML